MVVCIDSVLIIIIVAIAAVVIIIIVISGVVVRYSASPRNVLWFYVFTMFAVLYTFSGMLRVLGLDVLICCLTDVLTLSLPIPLKLYTLPYWPKPLFFNFWHSGALALSPERQSAWMSEIKNSGLDQYRAEPFKQQQFGRAGVEGVK